ncbi:MAG: transposase [Liquorilactobacillus sp.]
MELYACYNRTNVYDFNFHLVFVTKYRKSIFTNEQARSVMKDILYTMASNNNTEIEYIENQLTEYNSGRSRH